MEKLRLFKFDALAEAIPEVAREHVGALGDLDLNAAGDLAQANYDILRVAGGGWQYYGTYEATRDSIVFAAMDGDADGEEATGGEAMAGESAADGEKATGGCLIATASYGSELAPQVQLLREIRDATLLPTASGAYFMAGFNQMYYSFSPAIADLERENPAFREAVRVAITPAMYAMGVMTLADPGSEASVLAFGMLSIGAVAGMYLVGPYLAVRAVKRWVRRGWCKNAPAPQP